MAPGLNFVRSVLLVLALLPPAAVGADEGSTAWVGQSTTSVFNDTWQKILKEAEIRPQFMIATEEEKRRHFVEGQIVLDCCTIPAWRDREDERAVQIYTAPFFYSSLHIVHRPDLPVAFKKPEDLRSFKVAVVRGHDYVHGAFFGETVEAVGLDDAFQLVADGYADMAVANRQEFHFLMQGRELALALGPQLHTLALRARVHMSRIDLLDKLNDAIARMKARGQIDQVIGSSIRLSDQQIAIALAGDADTRALRSVWRLILSESGMPYRIVEMPGARKRRMFSDGGIVLDCCVVPEWRDRPEERSVQQFSDVFYESHEHFILPAQATYTVSHPSDLKDFTVAVVRGFDLPPAYQAIIPGGNIDDVLQLVATGRAQVAMINAHDFKMHMAARPRALKLGGVSEVAPLRIRVHTSRPDVLARVNAAISRLRAAGTIELMLEGRPDR